MKLLGKHRYMLWIEVLSVVERFLPLPDSKIHPGRFQIMRSMRELAQLNSDPNPR